MKPNVKLFKHQEDAKQFIIRNVGVAAIFHEVGCGKTLTGLSAFEYLRKQEVDSLNDLRLLVICPLSLIEGAWGEDIEKFTNFRYCNLHKVKTKIDKRCEIFIANFEWIRNSNNREALEKWTKQKQFMCIIDESSKLKNHQSKTTQYILDFKDIFKYKLIMSGTPAPNIEWEYWPQITFLRSNILHWNFYAFKSRYFHLVRGGEVIHGSIKDKKTLHDMLKKGFEYKMTGSKRQEMMEKIKPLCHLAKKKDCLDLPDQTDEYRIIPMGKEQKKSYDDMKRHSIAEILNQLEVPQDATEDFYGSPIVARIALTKIMKLRQITSGFGIAEDGNVYKTKENPKLDELLSILEEIGNKQVIIWCNFTYEIDLLKKQFGENCRCLHGGIKQSIKDQDAKDFKAGKFQYLICHPKSAGHGLTFVNCAYEIFFSLNYSFEEYEQSKGRIHRAGQTENCTYIHLLCENTIDEDVLSVLQRKATLGQLAERWLKR